MTRSTPHASTDTAGYQLRFRSLFHAGRGFAFPCDADGRVDLDALAEATRRSYREAWDAVGRELSTPSVEATRN
jgi:hypothetical protein